MGGGETGLDVCEGLAALLVFPSRVEAPPITPGLPRRCVVRTLFPWVPSRARTLKNKCEPRVDIPQHSYSNLLTYTHAPLNTACWPEGNIVLPQNVEPSITLLGAAGLRANEPRACRNLHTKQYIISNNTKFAYKARNNTECVKSVLII